MSPVKVIVAGGRDFDDYQMVTEKMCIIEELHHDQGIIVISGGAKGADALGERWAREFGHSYDVMVAPWAKYGKAAGPIRNEQMAAIGNVLVAFWDGRSKGTRHMLGAAIRQGLEVHLFRYDNSGQGELFGKGGTDDEHG